MSKIHAVLHYADGNDCKCKYRSSGLEMSSESLLRSCHCHMRVDFAVDDISVHADHVRRLSRILYEHILRREIAVTYLVHLVSPHGSGAGKDDCVLYPFLLYHLFDASQ